MSKISKDELNPQLKQDIERIPTQETLDNFSFTLVGLNEEVEELKNRPSSEPLYAECDTSPSEQNKAIILSRVPEKGEMLNVRFRWGNTASNPKLSITAAGSILTGVISNKFTPALSWTDMQTITFIYRSPGFEIPANNVYATNTNAGVVKVDGTSIVANPTTGVISAPKPAETYMYAVCTEASASSTKKVTVPGFKPVAGSPVTIKFTQANTVNTMLEIDSTDPDTGIASSVMGNVYTRGVQGATWKAGDVITFVYTENAFEVETNGAPDRAEFDSLFNSVSNGKTAVANAITQKGITTSATAEFATMATNISNIVGLKSKSQQFTVTGSNTASTETNSTLDAGFPVEFAIIVYHDFWASSTEKTGAVAVYSKAISVANPVVQAGGYQNNSAYRGVILPNHLSNGNNRTRISGNTVIVNSTYYNQIAMPAQTFTFSVYAFG